MKLIPSLSKIPNNYFKKNILILGIFDGVHFGHQFLIKKAILRAGQIKAKTIIFTFWPHPKESLSIIPIKERIGIFNNLGINYCIIKKFTKSFARIPASGFINLIIKKIGPVEIFIGENFHFGKNREGNASLLAKFCKNNGIKLNTVKLCKLNNQIISSSLIRSLIQKGKLEKAARFLGRPVYIIGRVTEGKALGRKLGFPTANILPYHEILPPIGVYAVRVVFNKQEFMGMAYIGKKPTIFHHHRINKLFIEAHIFNFKNNIYGKDIKLLFLKKIRSEIKFKDISALKNQLKKDEEKIRSFLS